MFYAKEFCSYFQSGNLIEKTFFFCCCLVNAFFSVLIFWQVPIPTHPQARTYSEAVGTSSLFYIYGKAIFPLAFCIILKAAKIYFSYLCEYFLSFFLKCNYRSEDRDKNEEKIEGFEHIQKHRASHKYASEEPDQHSPDSIRIKLEIKTVIANKQTNFAYSQQGYQMKLL